MWCWKRLLRVPWTARRSNQSTLNEISPEYSLEGLMLKLKLQYFGHLRWRTASLERMILGMIEDKRRRGPQRMRWWSLTWWRWVWVSFGSWWWAGKLGVLQSTWSQKVGHDWAHELNLCNNFVLWRILTGLTLMIIFKCIEISIHYSVYQELMYFKKNKQNHIERDKICGYQRQGKGGRIAWRQ